MPISALPPSPSRLDAPDVFSDKADAFLGALPAFVTQANALQTDVNSKQSAAATSATNAANSASAAATSASNAASSASSAAGNASTATTKATEAANSASAAAASAAAAATFDPAGYLAYQPGGTLQNTKAASGTNAYGFSVPSGYTGATNNYGFYGNIPSGTGRWNFYAAGTAGNYFAGRLELGQVSAAENVNVYSRRQMSGSTSTWNIYARSEIQSDVTSYAASFQSEPTTAATAFTLSTLDHYSANQGAFGVGSTVTNQAGFRAGASLIGATNNYGFYSSIPSGAGRWNFYAAGTAANYFGGPFAFKPGSSATPANNGDLTFEATSNTSVTIKLRGSDGVVRSAVITLS